MATYQDMIDELDVYRPTPEALTAACSNNLMLAHIDAIASQVATDYCGYGTASPDYEARHGAAFSIARSAILAAEKARRDVYRWDSN